ncbi:MAG: TonB family protein [Proteiniphilum sp.]|nr:TonB family protein [Proteiniphilum sp.]MDD2938014.1 TonB family protein [Proteiniphilum sp.]MDD3075813.1 TonB family protein [Proteiniphilum sp.]MDD3780230.1 TonB family protein [Proteiniphilum sp.]MDD3956037.1 TonB family protein [Proteiniphilum sp.]
MGTTIFAVLLLLLLLFTYFTHRIPPQELEGIPVMFGATEDAYGVTEAPMAEVTPTPSQTPVVPEYRPNEPMITQTAEPTIDVEAQREEARRQALLAEERRKQEEAERIRRAEEARRREINQQMSGLFGESAGSRGNTEGSGTQGVSTGNAAQGSPSGTGGIGSYDLGGRSLGSGGLVQPRYNVNDYGTVVVNITVDPNGNVINTEIGRGTNTPNTALRNEALRAARNTKFNAITSPNNQQGTITYRFNLK